MGEENHKPAYKVFLRNDKTGDLKSASATRFQHITSQDLRHWAYPDDTIVGRAADGVAEIFDFPRAPEVVDYISTQGYSIRQVDTSPLSPPDKLSELLYVSLSQNKELRHPITHGLILSTDNLILLVVNFGSDPINPDGTLPDTCTIDKITHPVIGQIRDGEPSFCVKDEELNKYLQTDDVIYHRFADLGERDVMEARAAQRAEKKAAKRRAQKEKRGRAQGLPIGERKVKSSDD
ncbi:hypothetical protein MBLNU457_g0526t1 [Dothideomycetes sp. NU457]